MKSNRCEGCGERTTAAGSVCRTCKSKLFHAKKRIKAEGLIVDQAGTSWWVWTAKGQVLVLGQSTKQQAVRALAWGDTTDAADLVEVSS